METVIEPSGSCYELLEEALQKIAKLEVALAKAEAKGAIASAPASPTYGTVDCPKCKTRIPMPSSFTITGISEMYTSDTTTGTYAGIVRSIEPMFRSKK